VDGEYYSVAAGRGEADIALRKNAQRYVGRRADDDNASAEAARSDDLDVGELVNAGGQTSGRNARDLNEHVYRAAGAALVGARPLRIRRAVPDSARPHVPDYVEGVGNSAALWGWREHAVDSRTAALELGLCERAGIQEHHGSDDQRRPVEERARRAETIVAYTVLHHCDFLLVTTGSS
jgi:hypothetical protein